MESPPLSSSDADDLGEIVMPAPASPPPEHASIPICPAARRPRRPRHTGRIRVRTTLREKQRARGAATGKRTLEEYYMARIRKGREERSLTQSFILD